MSFRPIAFLDVTAVQGMLFTKYRDRWKPESPATDVIPLRTADNTEADDGHASLDCFDLPILTEWKSLKGLLNRVKHAAAGTLNGQPVLLGKAALVSLKAGHHVDWHVDEDEHAKAHIRLELAVSTNPGAWLYSGPFTAQPPVGQLLWVNNRILHSATNFGEIPRIHLIVDVRKAEE